MGYNKVNAIAYDGAGNRSSQYIWVVRREVQDTTKPTASWISPSNGQVITTRTLRLEASAQDSGSGISHVLFSAKWSGTWRQLARIDSTNGPWAFTWDICAAGVPDGNTDIELGLQAYDKAGNEYVMSQHTTNYHITKQYQCAPNPNQSPNANAGPDQTVTDTDGNGAEWVNIDGSSSSDPDGDELVFVWMNGSRELGRAARLAVELSVGTHELLLYVGVPDLAHDFDTVIIVVTPTEQSQPTLTLDKTKSKYNGWAMASVCGFAPSATVNVR